MRLRRLPLRAFLALAILLTHASCALFQPSAESEKAESVGTGEAASSRIAEALPHGSGLETIAIVGTNDIHGALTPLELKTREDGGAEGISYRAGGLAYLASYLNVLKDEWGSHLIWLDAGDEFQGSIESNTEGGAPLVSFFNLEGLAAAAIGNHEFDFGSGTGNVTEPGDVLGVLKTRMREAHYPYLAANVRDAGGTGLSSLPDARPSRIFGVGGLRVGVIGLSTLQTPTTTRAQFVAGLDFTDMKEAVAKEAAALRLHGADGIVLVAHSGTVCETGRVTPGLALRKPSDPLGVCNPDGEIAKLLTSLPPGTVDAVVAGHTHQIIHHWIAGVPVIEGGAYGRYFNIVYLTYDLSKHRFAPELARIEGPVPVCPQIFANQHDCNGDRKAPAPKFGASTDNAGRGDLVIPEYHGRRIVADSGAEKLLADVVAKTAPIKARVVGQAGRRIDHQRFMESELGDLTADAIREAAKADVGLVNSGGLRAPIEAGPITYGEVFRSMPFENTITTVRLTGTELLLLLRIAESGSRGFAGVSGVRLKLIAPQSDAPGSDLDGDGRIEAWELNRLLGAELADGTPIDPQREYRLATLDFLVTGGDDLGWFFSKIPAERIDAKGGPVMRDAMVDHLQKLTAASGPINSVSAPIIDPQAPRLDFVKAQKKGKRRLGRRKKKTTST